MGGEWITRRIGELGRVITGKTPSTSDPANFDGPYPFVTIPDLDGRVYINRTERTLSEQGAERMKSCLLPPGAVMMSCIATVGKCGITTTPSFTNQQINSVVPGSDIDVRFLYYVFTQLGHELESAGGGGSVYTNVSKTRFSEIQITFPKDLDEQRAIAHILGTLDDKIELNWRMNETLEAMARAIFISWFVDFDPVRARAVGRDPSLTKHIADLFPDRFEDLELNKIPESWRIGVVGDLGEVICGKTPPTCDPENYGTHIPFVTIPDMHGKVFVTATSKSLSSKGAATQSKKTLPSGAICVSCIATVGLVVLTSECCQTNQQINSLIPIEPDNSFYCYFALQRLADGIRSWGSGGSVVLNLNKGQFAALPVLVPSKAVAAGFQQLVGPIFDRILANERESRTLAVLRDVLLPKLLSGDLPMRSRA